MFYNATRNKTIIARCNTETERAKAHDIYRFRLRRAHRGSPAGLFRPRDIIDRGRFYVFARGGKTGIGSSHRTVLCHLFIMNLEYCF